ncbi:MAG: type II toxin-antitoxin system VapC family toxin [Nitrospirae bacterium]|nr:type II toxin-antitoxin system VapC family toxin [Nitrospirota bacterium]
MNYLLDTDIFIDWLRGNKNIANFIHKTQGIFFYSSVTRKELLSLGNSTSEREKILNLLRTMRIIRIDSVIALKASELLNKYHNRPLYKADSLIAATACVKKMILVTRNRKHFEFIEEIKLLIPVIK